MHGQAQVYNCPHAYTCIYTPRIDSESKLNNSSNIAYIPFRNSVFNNFFALQAGGNHGAILSAINDVGSALMKRLVLINDPIITVPTILKPVKLYYYFVQVHVYD